MQSEDKEAEDRRTPTGAAQIIIDAPIGKDALESPRTPDGPPDIPAVDEDDLKNLKGRMLIYLGPKTSNVRLVRVGNLLESLRCRVCLAPCQRIRSVRLPGTAPQAQDNLGWTTTEYRVFHAGRVHHIWNDPYASCAEMTERQWDLPGFECNAQPHAYAGLLSAVLPRCWSTYGGSPLFIGRVVLGREKIVDCDVEDLEFIQQYFHSTFRTLHLQRGGRYGSRGNVASDQGKQTRRSWFCNIL